MVYDNSFKFQNRKSVTPTQQHSMKTRKDSNQAQSLILGIVRKILDGGEKAFFGKIFVDPGHSFTSSQLQEILAGLVTSGALLAPLERVGYQLPSQKLKAPNVKVCHYTCPHCGEVIKGLNMVTLEGDMGKPVLKLPVPPCPRRQPSRSHPAST